MAFTISPGINVTETDLTTIVPAVGTTVGAIAGPFRWGPALKRMLIDSELTQKTTFGLPDNATANTWFTLANFFTYASAAQVVRVIKVGNSLSVQRGNSDTTGYGASAAFTVDPVTGAILTVTPLSVGQYYTATPNVVVLGPPGATAATITANAPVGGQITGYNVISGGTGYTVGHLNATANGDGVLIENEDVYLAEFASGQGAAYGSFAAKYPGDLGNSLEVSVADAFSFATWPYRSSFPGAPNTSLVVANAGGTNDEMHVVVVDSEGLWTGTSGTVLETFPFVSKCAIATAEDGSSIYYSEVINRNSNYVWWMGHPITEPLGNWGSSNPGVVFDVLTVQLLTGTVSSGPFTTSDTVTDAAGVTVIPSGSGAIITATVNAGSDSGASAPDISFTYTNRGTGYYAAPNVSIVNNTHAGDTIAAHATVADGQIQTIVVDSVGAGQATADSLTVTITTPGSGAAGSLTLNSNGTILAVAVTDPGSSYNWPPVVTVSGPGSGAQIQTVLGSGPTAGEVVSFNVVNGGYGYTTVSGKVISVNATGSDSNSVPYVVVQPISGNFEPGQKIVGSSSGASATILNVGNVLSPNSSFYPFGGVVGGALTVALGGGADGNAFLQDGDYLNGLVLFQSGIDVDVSLIMGADADQVIADYLISDIAEYRKDCVVFLSPPQNTVVNNAGNEAVDIVSFRDTLPSTSYAVMDSGWKYQYDKYNDLYRWVPLNGDIAGLCAQTDSQRDPWWSPAGYNRGNIKNIVRLAWNPRQAYRDLLYQAGVNSVMTDPGQGTILFGDKTMLSKPSAFDRINVRRLFIVLEKAISTAAKFTLFEFNDQFTQAQFVSMVEPYLRDVQGRRGIFDYKVVCDSSNNTPDVVDANEFIGDIYVKPARSINFIQLNFVAVRTGVDFSEIVGSV